MGLYDVVLHDIVGLVIYKAVEQSSVVTRARQLPSVKVTE